MKNIACYWLDNPDIYQLDSHLKTNRNTDILTAAVYNIHYWKYHWQGFNGPFPPPANILKADMTILESLESYYFHGNLIKSSSPKYDAYSTILPQSSIPRVYPDALYNPIRIAPISFNKAIKGAIFVSTNCNEDILRTKFVRNIMMKTALRVDSPGTCVKYTISNIEIILR